MKGPTQFYLFGDQTSQFDAGLCRLLHIKDNPALTAFFERINYGLRLEIGQLPASQQAFFPRFNGLLELLARYRGASTTNPALDSSLVCLYQLACFISHFGEGTQAYPEPQGSYLIGLCTGLLSAAAISTSRTVVELLPAAIEAVLIAFRTGLRTLSIRNRLGSQSDISSPWSLVVALEEGVALESLKVFNALHNLPPHSQLYLSTVNAHNVTISGPPVILDLLLQSDAFSRLKPIRVSVHAPYHAPHLYTTDDVEAVLASCSKNTLELLVPRFSVLSSTTGKLLSAPNYGKLLQEVLHEILRKQIRWCSVLDGCSAVAEASGNLLCNVYSIAANRASQSLTEALSKTGRLQVKLDELIMTGVQSPRDVPTTGRPEHSKIAIIGYSGRFPDAASAEEFWSLLNKGLDVHREIPKDRFDVTTHFDATGKKKNTSQVRHGCWIENPGLFDARFFQMSPREAANTDPGQRLALATAYEAMEMAGFVPNRTPSTQCDRVGVVYGMTSSDWCETNSAQNIDTYFIPGGNRAFTPGRINYFFNLSGPSLSIDTACSSSAAAIHTACNTLWRGDCDTVIAGGTNIMTNPDNFAGLDRGHFLSRTGNCNTFDDAADGYCRADGVGTVILKRLEDALTDNDPILGVILGACTNHSAEAGSITRPHVGAQAYLFGKLLNDTNIDPLDVSYIEMHGTGTQAGDAGEMKSVLDVFSPPWIKRCPDRALHLGSAKANVGHAESASGIISLVKLLLMMEKNEIPPHPGIKTKINRTFPSDLKERNIHIALKPTAWARKEGQKRTVFLNNFSAAGGNTAIIIQDAPPQAPRMNQDPRSTHLIAVSARSIWSLKSNIKALVDFIDNNKDVSIASLSYTTTARRMHHNYRVLARGSDSTRIKQELEVAVSKSSTLSVPARLPTVAFAYTGQGALYVGMAKTLFENFSQFREDIRAFDAIGQSLGFPSTQSLLDGSLTDLDNVTPLVAQLGTTCMQIALTRLWESWGVKPSVVIGHSLGEYAALNAAGVLSISDTLYLTGKRAQLLEQLCTINTHSMLAVKTSVLTLRQYLRTTACEVACINGPEDTVISGKTEDIEGLEKDLTAAGFKCIQLDVPFAFHSAQVQPILESFEMIANGVTFSKPSVPVLSPLLGVLVTDAGTFGPKYLSRACREIVNFLAAREASQKDKLADIWLEMGPHPVCCGMVKGTIEQTITLPSLRRNESSWVVLAGSLSSLYLAGIDIRWDEYHRDFKDCHEVIRLPTYCWENKNHWIQYVHDWCLTKGDDPGLEKKLEQPVVSKICTPSVQRIVEENINAHKPSIVIESDLSDPILQQAIQGHKVNGAALCPSSLYADIALTLGNYLMSQAEMNSSKTFMDVCNMSVDKPLIAHGKKQLFRVSATADWDKKIADIIFFSITNDGKKLADHAKCNVKFVSGDTWRKKWKRNEYLIKTRIEKLQNGVDNGQSHKIKRGMAYKLFSALVEYDYRYRGMEEVILDSEEYEATARVVFQASEKDGNYFFSPYWIDSLGHLAGFTMNANDAVDSRNQVYVNHGWESMRCTTRFSADSQYRTYVRMQKVSEAMFAGDVYIFDDTTTIVAVFKGMKFQGIPRNVLDMVLPPQSSATIKKPTVVLAQKTVTATTDTNTSPGIVTRALSIIAEEIGLTASDSELSPDSKFADFGIDSLLSLTIIGRFREELDMEFLSSFFFDHPTVRDLVRGLSQENILWSESASETPGTSEGEEEEDVISILRQALAEEMGILDEEIKGSQKLVELGMDSLLSLTVRGRLQETLSVELPYDLFLGNATLDSIAKALGVKSSSVTIPSQPSTLLGQKPSSSVKSPKPMQRASSIILQGNPKLATKILFLFPDGSGSATSYAQIPKLGGDVAVYGLNCPYMKNPEDLLFSLGELTTPYIDEIRRRQPSGPYYLGGWSAGGICAFDAAQKLMKAGESIARLIFIDTPYPIGLKKVPRRLLDYLNSIGLFGTGNQGPPEWLVPHFLAFIDSLIAYNAVPFATSEAPKTFMIWARDGVCKNPKDVPSEILPSDLKEMSWLLYNRTNHGPNGWDKLLGNESLVIETMYDANHFTMMKGENAGKLAGFIQRAMA